MVVQILLLLLRARAFFPLHAAALTPPARDVGGERTTGVLLVARSDSGKSTQAMGLVRAGWGFLSDDSLLLKTGGDATVEAFSLRREFGLDPEAARAFPEVTRHWRPFLTEERKRRVDMQQLYPEKAFSRCTPGLLIFPEIVNAPDSRLQSMRGSEALLALVSQSPLLTAHRETAPDHFEAIRKLILQAPAFRLYAGRDLKDAPELLSAMLTPLLESCQSALTWSAGAVQPPVSSGALNAPRIPLPVLQAASMKKSIRPPEGGSL